MTITGSPIDSDLFTGLQFYLTCSIYIPLVLESVPITVSAQWSKSDSTLVSNSRLLVEMVVEISPLLYEISLNFSSLNGTGGDDGNYTCTVWLTLSGAEGVTESATYSIYIQSKGKLHSLLLAMTVFVVV